MKILVCDDDREIARAIEIYLNNEGFEVVKAHDGFEALNVVKSVVGLIFVGLAYGGTPTLTSAYINKAFGHKYFPTNFSIANFSLIPAAIIGPNISAKLLEAAGGKYDSNFYALIVFTLVAFVLWVALNVTSKKSDNEGYK